MLGQLILGHLLLGGSAFSGGAGVANLKFVGGNGNGFLQWDAFTNATSYAVDGSPDGITWTNLAAANTTLNYQDTGAAARSANGFVYYRVKPNNSNAYSYTTAVSPYMMYQSGIAADGTLITAYAGELNQTGNAWKLISDGAIQVTGNKFVQKTASSGGVLLAAKETNQPDVSMTGLFQLGDGPTLRITDLANRYFFGVQSNRFSIFEVTAGSATERDFCTGSFSAGNDYLVTAACKGNVFTASIAGGSKSLTWTASTTPVYAGANTSSLHGFEMHGSGASSKITLAATNNIPGPVFDLQGDNATVSQWSDATFNGSNFTQAVALQQPVIVTNQLNGHSAVRFSTAKIMDGPNVQPVSKSFTHIALVKRNGTTGGNTILAGNSANSVSALLWLNSGANINADVLSGAAVVQEVAGNIALSTTNFDHIINNTFFDDPNNVTQIDPPTQAQHVYVNGVLAGMNRAAAVFPVTRAEISVGGVQGSILQGFNGDMARVECASTVPGASAADINRKLAETNIMFGLNIPLFTKQTLVIGDSLSHGYLATKTGTGSWIFLHAMRRPTRFYMNKGQPSIAMQGTNGITSEIEQQFATIAACGVPTNVFLWAGTNGISLYGQTGAQEYSGAVAMCNYLRSLPNVKRIVGIGMLPRGSSVETERQNMRALYLANWPSIMDVYADVDSVPAIGAANANLGANYADGTHLNDLGHGVLDVFLESILPSDW